MLKRIYISLLFLITGNLLFAQLGKSAYLKSGNKAFEQENFFGAAQMYGELLNGDKTNQDVAFKYAESCRLSFDYGNAVEWYKYALQYDSALYQLAFFRLAECYKSMSMYEQSGEQFALFLDFAEETDTFFTLKAKHEIDVLNKPGIIPAQVDSKIRIKRPGAGINSEFSEFAISEINDSVIYFSSVRPENDTGQFYTQTFVSEKKSGKWSEAMVFSISDSMKNKMSNVFFDQVGKIVYFTVHENISGKNYREIYRSKFEKNKWLEPEKLPEQVNYKETNNTQPVIARICNKCYLLFASNREGGFGKMDIWYCLVTGNSFGNARNIGSVINSIDDEITPFYCEVDTALYFSSKWHDNFGGFDIFKSRGDFTSWLNPENLGLPVNSSSNEVYYFINAAHKRAYFASNRPRSRAYKNEQCCNDIYMYDLTTEPDSLVSTLPENSDLIPENDIVGIINKLSKIGNCVLYFDNDQPEPGKKTNYTGMNYSLLAKQYIARKQEYIEYFCHSKQNKEKKEAETAINNFFSKKIEHNYLQLLEIARLLEIIVQNGKSAEIHVISSASPLASAGYNLYLSRRRNWSVVNFFFEYNNGSLKPYLENTSETGNRILIKTESLGEREAKITISDAFYDIQNSVYNPEAATERRVRVIVKTL